MSENSDTTQAQVDIATTPPPLIDVDGADVKPAPAAEEKKTDTPDATDETAKPETPEQQEVKKESRRTRQLNRERDGRIKAETEARFLREQLARSAPQQPNAAPKRENFDDYEAYLDARADWRVDQRQAEKQPVQTQRRAENTHDPQIAKQWVDRESAFQKDTTDYTEVVTPYVEDDLGRLSDGARRLIVDSEIGPKLLYHLAAHTDIADRIAGMPAHRQTAELGKLEDKLSATTVRTTKAPAPVQLVTGGNKTAGAGYSDNMSSAEFAAWGEKQGLRTFRKR